MAARPPLAIRASLAALASAGVIVAHRVAYALGDLNVHDQDALVGGHAYMPYVLAAAMGALVVAFGGYVTSQVSNPAPISGLGLYLYAALRLVALQSIGFVVLEMGERTFLGIAPAHLFGESVLTVGLLAQFICGLLGAVLLVLFAKGVVVLAKILRGVLPGSRSGVAPARWRAQSRWIPSTLTLGSISLRGPPLSI